MRSRGLAVCLLAVALSPARGEARAPPGESSFDRMCPAAGARTPGLRPLNAEVAALGEKPLVTTISARAPWSPVDIRYRRPRTAADVRAVTAALVHGSHRVALSVEDMMGSCRCRAGMGEALMTADDAPGRAVRVAGRPARIAAATGGDATLTTWAGDRCRVTLTGAAGAVESAAAALDLARLDRTCDARVRRALSRPPESLCPPLERSKAGMRGRALNAGTAGLGAAALAATVTERSGSWRRETSTASRAGEAGQWADSAHGTLSGTVDGRALTVAWTLSDNVRTCTCEPGMGWTLVVADGRTTGRLAAGLPALAEDARLTLWVADRCTLTLEGPAGLGAAALEDALRIVDLDALVAVCSRWERSGP